MGDRNNKFNASGTIAKGWCVELGKVLCYITEE